MPAPSTSQLELPLQPARAEPVAPRARTESELLLLFRRLGLVAVQQLRFHRNRTIMVTLTPAGLLRLHAGYAYAPERVLEAIARFLKRGTRRADRARYRAILLEFPVEEFAPSTRPLIRRSEAERPGDTELIARLQQLHAELNGQYFGGTLAEVPIRLSGKMRRRLGELRVERKSGAPVEIALSRRHLKSDGWQSFRDTLLHEMVHQWQGQSGLAVDHGKAFRDKARAVGIEPRAVRGER